MKHHLGSRAVLFGSSLALAWATPVLAQEIIPQTLIDRETAIRIWDFEDGQGAWHKDNRDITNHTVKDDILSGYARGADPFFIYDADDLQVENSAGLVVRIRCSQASDVALFWQNEERSFSPARSATLPVPANEWTVLRFDLSSHPHWQDKVITGLRLDPGLQGNTYEIDYIGLVDQFSDQTPNDLFLYTADFSQGSDGWRASSGIKNFSSSAGRLQGKQKGRHPRFDSPTIDVSSADGVIIEHFTSKNDRLTLQWATSTQGGFSSSRSEQIFAPLGGWRTLIFDLRNHPQWRNKTITKLRIIPAVTTSDRVAIGSVSIIASGALADADRDRLPDALEAVHQSDPAVPSPIRGKLAAELWRNTDFYSTYTWIASRDHLRFPSLRDLENGTTTGSLRRHRSRRARGYLTVPTAGNYRFWVSGRAGVQLLLSTDETKYRKTLIAELNPERNTVHGISYESSNLWDAYESQVSEEIYLEADQPYFLETLMTNTHTSNGHVSLAYAPAGQDREPLPTTLLSSYPGNLDDRDDDYLPDPWERQYGLKVGDDGRQNPTREGELGDFDSDGLTNLLEYLHGTDPSDADSDGDGLSDSEEINVYGTDPSTSDATSDQLIATIDPATVQGYGDTWTATSTGVLATNFRGKGVWDFNLPSDGFYIVQLSTDLKGDLRREEILPVIAEIDDRRVNRFNLIYRDDQPATLRLVTPFLKAGPHTFGLTIDNFVARRSLEVLSLKVVAPGGVDLNADGVPDHLAGTLTDRSYLTPRSVYSYYSPIFVEGRTPSQELVELTTIRHVATDQQPERNTSTEWNTRVTDLAQELEQYAPQLQASLRSGGSRLGGGLRPFREGAGNHGWYRALALNPNKVTGLVAQFEDYGIYQNQVLAWRPYNLLDGGELRLPRNSDLLFGAWTSEADTASVTITLDGTALGTIPANETLTHRFSQAGRFTLTATHPGGQTASLIVDVRSANVPGGISITENAMRSMNFHGVEHDLGLVGGEDLMVRDHKDRPGHNGSVALLGSLVPGQHNLSARLGTGSDDILHTRSVTVIGHSDALRNGNDIIIPQSDGLFLVRSTLLITPLPENVTVEVVIFAEGVTFPDGTTRKDLTHLDFNEHGVFILEFLMDEDNLRAPCHYVRIRDQHGATIFHGR